MSPADGATFIAFIKHNPAHLVVIDVVGFLSLTLGLLLLAVALWRARSVPRWLPITLLVLLVAQFAAPNRVLDVVQAALMAVAVVIGVFYLRAAGARA